MTSATGTNIQRSSRVARSDAIVFTEFDDATVMMDAHVGRYYELNATGARIWDLIESGPRVAEVCQALVAEYQVALDACDDEVRAFLHELHHRDVMRILPGNGTNEIANDTRDREAPSLSERASAGRLGEAGTRLAWMTPGIRVMAIARTADGDNPTYPPKEGSLNFYYYRPPS